MLQFEQLKNIKLYLKKNNLKKVILFSQARSGSTFCTYFLAKYLGFKKKYIFPEEIFLNKHFIYLKHFTGKHEKFFLNTNEFILKRPNLNREDILFIYLYRNPKDILRSYKKAKKNNFYHGWKEFYSRYKKYYLDINQNLNVASFNHKIWLKQKKLFKHCFTINYDSLKFFKKFRKNRNSISSIKDIGLNTIVDYTNNKKINFNIFEKLYFFIRRKLESRKNNIENY